jgi:hypothetical protein
MKLFLWKKKSSNVHEILWNMKFFHENIYEICSLKYSWNFMEYFMKIFPSNVHEISWNSVSTRRPLDQSLTHSLWATYVYRSLHLPAITLQFHQPPSDRQTACSNEVEIVKFRTLSLNFWGRILLLFPYRDSLLKCSCQPSES